MPKCPLCDPIERKTDWLYSDDEFHILICETCKTPMIVFRRHGVDSVPLSWKLHAEAKAKELFGDRYLYLRTFQRSIANHLHWHIIVKEAS